MSDSGSTQLRVDPRGRHAALTIEPGWRGVLRWGGLSLFGAGAVLAIFVALVFGLGQTLPVPAPQVLAEPTRPALLFVLAAVGGLLLMPAALGLYHLLEGVHRTAVYLTTSFWQLAVALFLASRAMILAAAQLNGSYISTNDATTQPSACQVLLGIPIVIPFIGLVLSATWQLPVGATMVGLARRSVL